MDQLRQVVTDMAKTVNYAFLFADADLPIPDSDIQANTVQDAYTVPLEDLYKLADANLTEVDLCFKGRLPALLPEGVGQCSLSPCAEPGDALRIVCLTTGDPDKGFGRPRRVVCDFCASCGKKVTRFLARSVGLVRIESIGPTKFSDDAAGTPTTLSPPGTGPDIPLFRPGLSGPGDRSVRA